MWLGEEDWINVQGDKKFLYWQDLIEANGYHRCTRRRAYWVGDTQHLPPDDNIYRVQIEPDTGYVSVACMLILLSYQTGCRRSWLCSQ
jgi:hypothetical protein